MPDAAAPAPRLATPGAGLPPLEAWLARRLGPLAFARKSWDAALAQFQGEGERLLVLAEGLDPERFARPVLIRRVFGIEDSSRNWSPEMVLEHLVIVGGQIGEVVVALSRGERPGRTADIAAVKPRGGRSKAEALTEFRALLPDFARTLTERIGDRNSRATHPHPWFGGLTARQWTALAGAHQRIHRRQMEAILRA